MKIGIHEIEIRASEQIPRTEIVCMPALPRMSWETFDHWRDRCVAASVWIVNIEDQED